MMAVLWRFPGPLGGGPRPSPPLSGRSRGGVRGLGRWRASGAPRRCGTAVAGGACAADAPAASVAAGSHGSSRRRDAAVGRGARARVVEKVRPVSAAASGPVTAALVQRRADVPPQAAGLPGHWFWPPVVGTHEPERQRLLCPHHPPPKGQSGGHRLRPCHWFPSPPIPPRGGLCGGALRVRWVALLALQPRERLPLAAGGAHSECGPPPTPRRHRARAPAAKPARLALPARGARAPVCPPGAPRRQHTPARARRNESLAAGRAHAVKAKPYGWRAKNTRASLDSARPAAGSWSPPGRKTGWGKGRATRVAVRSSVALPLVAAIRLRRHRSGSPWTSSLTWWLGVGGLLPWWRQARSGLHLRAEA